MQAKSHLARKITVVIVEDHRMFREQLVHLIEKANEMMVVGEADNIREGFALIQQKQPNIAILDITLKGSSGIELLKDLRAHRINVPVLILSMHDESIYAERALRAGARGYMTKHEASENVLTAIRDILNGLVYLNPRFVSRVMSRMGEGNELEVRPIDRLADRELEVFELIGRGLTSREIGVRLGLGVTTVDTYRRRIKEKLNLENAARLRWEASRWVQERE
jgi:DNA-binding NarL/FixJ family response regulator